jgi:hypothetical protein
MMRWEGGGLREIAVPFRDCERRVETRWQTVWEDEANFILIILFLSASSLLPWAQPSLAISSDLLKERTRVVPSWGDRGVGQTLQEHTLWWSEARGSCWERWRPTQTERGRSWNIRWSGRDRRRTRDLNKNKKAMVREGEEGRERRRDHSPLTMKPLISSLNRLTSHDTNTPPAGMLRTVWLLLLLGSQDPIPDTADTGRHLMRTREGRKLRRPERRWRCERWEASSLKQRSRGREAEAEAQ